jgi:putative MFS transporter
VPASRLLSAQDSYSVGPRPLLLPCTAAAMHCLLLLQYCCYSHIFLISGYASCICFYQLPSDVSWRVMIGVALAPAALVLSTVFCVLPESPRWLIRQGREAEAQEVLTKVQSINSTGHPAHHLHSPRLTL